MYGPLDTYRFEFSTYNAGELADADETPTGVLVVNGTDTAATVTITNVTTGVYKGSCVFSTLSLSIGDTFYVRVTATVNSVTAKKVTTTERIGIGAVDPGAIDEQAIGDGAYVFIGEAARDELLNAASLDYLTDGTIGKAIRDITVASLSAADLVTRIDTFFDEDGVIVSAVGVTAIGAGVVSSISDQLDIIDQFQFDVDNNVKATSILNVNEDDEATNALAEMAGDFVGLNDLVTTNLDAQVSQVGGSGSVSVASGAIYNGPINNVTGEVTIYRADAVTLAWTFENYEGSTEHGDTLSLRFINKVDYNNRTAATYNSVLTKAGTASLVDGTLTLSFTLATTETDDLPAGANGDGSTIYRIQVINTTRNATLVDNTATVRRRVGVA